MVPINRPTIALDVCSTIRNRTACLLLEGEYKTKPKTMKQLES